MPSHLRKLKKPAIGDLSLVEIAIDLGTDQPKEVEYTGTMFFHCLVFLFASLLIGPPSSADAVLFADDFESGEASAIFKYLKAHGHDVAIISDGGTNQSQALEVQYDGFYKGSVRVKGFFNLSKRVNEASLSYDVFFHNDFQFVQGGKIHGLGPDQPVTGDWKAQPDGWSTRAIFGKDGRIEINLYHQDQKFQWGDSRDNEQFRFAKGRYYAVTLSTKLNSESGKKDGEARIYLNGKLLVQFNHIRFWQGDGRVAQISQFLFSTFHGGGTPEWSPRDKQGRFKNVHATFDNFMVREGLHIREQSER